MVTPERTGPPPGIETLARLTRTLLTADDPGDLAAAATALHGLLAALSGCTEGSCDADGTAAILLPSGEAIAPIDAARCALDVARTSKYLRGIHAAISECRTRFGHRRPIDVLYAGCGPFATLALPLMTQFAADEVRFTLLDINPRALACARGATTALGLAGHVRDVVEADATTYRHPADEPLHIVVVEAMQRALAKEPQVAITLNLAPQLVDGGMLIPEAISVDACLYDPAAEFGFQTADGEPVQQPVRLVLARLMELTADAARRLATSSSPFPAVTAAVPPHGARNLSIMLRTEIRVFGAIEVGEYESGITCPLGLHELGVSNEADRLSFEYVMGSGPQFRCRRLTPPSPTLSI